MRAANRLAMLLSCLGVACGVGDADPDFEQSARDFFFREAVRRGRVEARVTTETAVCVAAMPNNVIDSRSPTFFPDPLPPILKKLATTDPRVVPGSACTLDDAPGGPPNWGMLARHRSTGDPAIFVWVGPVLTIGTDRATSRIGYQEHGLSAAQWRCGAVRSDTQWHITNCEPEWQS